MSKGKRKPTYEELERENQTLREENETLRRKNRVLRRKYETVQDEKQSLREQLDASHRRIRRLEDKVEELQRTSCRQAAPFRRKKKDKKASSGGSGGSPGRKPGHEPAWRQEPERVDEEKVVPLERCPHCDGPVEDVRPVEQYIEDIPPVKVRIIRLVTHRGHCPRCGPVRSTHPLQMSRAAGAAKVQLGPRTLGLAAYMKYHLGLSFRKMVELLEVFGLSVTPGGLSQALARVAVRLVGVWLDILKRIRGSPVAHADETSWYVGRPGWWLWVFTTPEWTLYVVDKTRASDVVERTLGSDFSGVLVSDCLSSYDPIECRKHKCWSHHLKALSEAIERLPDGEVKPLKRMQVMLRAGIVLGQMHEEISSEHYNWRRSALEESVDRLLEAPQECGGVDKALERFRRQREHLFTFLHEPQVPATNNLAERQLRPAVIARKISCGNKTDWGRLVWQILSSISATCHQQGIDFMDFIATHTPLEAPSPTLAAA